MIAILLDRPLATLLDQHAESRRRMDVARTLCNQPGMRFDTKLSLAFTIEMERGLQRSLGARIQKMQGMEQN